MTPRLSRSVVDPHHVDADADPDLDFTFKKAQTLEKVLK
jgi:hypothetical protein